MSALTVFEADVRAQDVKMSPAEWAALRARVSEVAYRAKDVILSQTSVADRWLFVSSGVAASEQLAADGGSSIARFFESGQICSNLTSVWRKEIGADDLIAITNVEGVLIPDAVFREGFFGEGGFSRYVRAKAMEALLFDKDLICAKTSIETEVRYQFLEQRHAAVVAEAPQKDVARFLGITPQGLSRFLRNRRPRT